MTKMYLLSTRITFKIPGTTLQQKLNIATSLNVEKVKLKIKLGKAEIRRQTSVD